MPYRAAPEPGGHGEEDASRTPGPAGDGRCLFPGAGHPSPGHAWRLRGGWPVCRGGTRVPQAGYGVCLHRERGTPMRIASEAGQRVLVVAGAVVLAAAAVLEATAVGAVGGGGRPVAVTGTRIRLAPVSSGNLRAIANRGRTAGQRAG